MRPRLQAETSVEARSTVYRTTTTSWTVTAAKKLTVLDASLDPVASFPLEADWSGIHAVTPDTTAAALSLADRVALVDPTGHPYWQIPHRPWSPGCSGSTWVTPGGQVWAVVPDPDDEGKPDRWWVLDLATGTRLADLALDGHSCGSEPVGHAGGVMLSLIMAGGDDGSRIYAGRHDAGSTGLLRMPGVDRVLADVHRCSERYLSTHRDHEDVAVHTLGNGTGLVRRSAGEIFGAGDLVDFHAAFVTDERVVVRSVLGQHHVVLDAATLEVIGPVEYPDGAARDTVLPTGDGRWVTTDWLDGRIQLWALEESTRRGGSNPERRPGDSNPERRPGDSNP